MTPLQKLIKQFEELKDSNLESSIDVDFAISLAKSLLEKEKEVMCEFIDWLNLHTHFYKPVPAKLWYDRSRYYGDKGFTNEEVFKLFLEQHCT